jgi:hypothetical protein
VVDLFSRPLHSMRKPFHNVFGLIAKHLIEVIEP